MENAVGSGSLSVDDYKEILNSQLIKDTALLAHFKQAGDTARVAIVTERISDIKTELQDL